MNIILFAITIITCHKAFSLCCLSQPEEKETSTQYAFTVCEETKTPLPTQEARNPLVPTSSALSLGTASTKKKDLRAELCLTLFQHAIDVESKKIKTNKHGETLSTNEAYLSEVVYFFREAWTAAAKAHNNHSAPIDASKIASYPYFWGKKHITLTDVENLAWFRLGCFEKLLYPYTPFASQFPDEGNKKFKGLIRVLALLDEPNAIFHYAELLQVNLTSLETAASYSTHKAKQLRLEIAELHRKGALLGNPHSMIAYAKILQHMLDTGDAEAVFGKGYTVNTDGIFWGDGSGTQNTELIKDIDKLFKPYLRDEPSISRLYDEEQIVRRQELMSTARRVLVYSASISPKGLYHLVEFLDLSHRNTLDIMRCLIEHTDAKMPEIMIHLGRHLNTKRQVSGTTQRINLLTHLNPTVLKMLRALDEKNVMPHEQVMATIHCLFSQASTLAPEASGSLEELSHCTA